MEEIRLQKVIADSGVCSRRKAEEMITAGRVKINGHPAHLGQKIDPRKDDIMIDGKKLELSKGKKRYFYLMLNKPRGYLTSMEDDRGRRCVTELLKEFPERVYPVGRLDLTSEGLLLFTNDGEFANMMTHPSHQVTKTYRVTVAKEVTDEQMIRLSEGVEIEGKMTGKADVRVVTEEERRTVMLMTISEGRNRQIRKMCEAVNLEVIRLKRISVGPLKLGMLKPGEFRELTGDEVDMLVETSRRGAMGKIVAKETVRGVAERRIEKKVEPKKPKPFREPSLRTTIPKGGARFKDSDGRGKKKR